MKTKSLFSLTAAALIVAGMTSPLQAEPQSFFEMAYGEPKFTPGDFKPAFAISAAISPISNSLARNGQKVPVPVE